MVASLRSVSEVGEVGEAGSVDAARRDERLTRSTLVLLDHELPGARRLVRELHDDREVPIIICTANLRDEALLASIEAGACGFLAKDSLTPETLAASIRAVRSGAGVMAPGLLGSVLEGASRLAGNGHTHAAGLPRLNPREQNVLRLIAEGCRTREVAQRLSYSERTIKNVVHDITTKLQVRSRSQAVAEALREGLI